METPTKNSVRTPKKNPRFRNVDADEAWVESSPSSDSKIIPVEIAQPETAEKTPEVLETSPTTGKSKTPQNDPSFENIISQLSSFSKESQGLKTPVRRVKTPRKSGSKSRTPVRSNRKSGLKTPKSSLKKSAFYSSPRKTVKRKLNLSPDEQPTPKKIMVTPPEPGLSQTQRENSEDKLLIEKGKEMAESIINDQDDEDDDDEWEEEDEEDEDDEKLDSYDEEFGEVDMSIIENITKVLENTQKKYNISKRNATTIVHELEKTNILENVREAISKQVNCIQEEEENIDSLYDALFEPKMTRAKFKYRAQDGQQPVGQSSDWINEEIEKSLLDYALDDDDDNDQVYEPSHDSEEESDIDSKSSVADLGSPQNQVMTPKTATEDSQNMDMNVTRLSKEVPTIAKRTRSKHPLTECDLSEIEASFLAPDVTPDLYDLSTDSNPDWLRFLTNLSKDPKMDVTNEEEDDEEFNVMKEMDESDDETEEFRSDKAVKIPKQEVSDLIDEIFSDLVSEDGQDIEKTFTDQNEEVKAEQEVNTIETKKEFDLTRLNKNIGSMRLKDLIEIKNNLGKDLIAEDKEKSKPVKPRLVFSLTHHQGRQLMHQMQKHVQILAQTFVLTAGSKHFESSAINSKTFLLELQLLGEQFMQINNISASFFIPGNLKAALEVCEVDTYFPCENELKRYKQVLSARQKDIFMNSQAFVHLDLLPSKNYEIPETSGKNTSTKKKHFTHAEDHLLAIAISEMSNFHNEQLESCKLISDYLMPTISGECIRNHIEVLNSERTTRVNNAVALYIKEGRLPDYPRPTELASIVAPINNSAISTIGPKWCLKYKQMKSKRDVKESSDKKDTKLKLQPKIQQPVVILIQEKQKPPETTYLIPFGTAQNRPPSSQIILLDSPAKTAITNMDKGCDLLQACAAACGIEGEVKVKLEDPVNDSKDSVIKKENSVECMDTESLPVPPTPEYQSIDILNTPESSPEKEATIQQQSASLSTSPKDTQAKTPEVVDKIDGDYTNLGMTLSSESSDEEDPGEANAAGETQEMKMEEDDEDEDEEDAEEDEEEDEEEEESPFLLSVASLLIGDRTPPKLGLKSFSPKKNLSPAKVIAKRLTDKAKRKLLSIEKKELKETVEEKVEEKDCEDVENIDPKENTQIEQTKKDINSKLKQEIAKKIMDDELLDKDPNKLEKEKSFVVGLCKLVQTTAGSEKFKELLEACVKFNKSRVMENESVLKLHSELSAKFVDYPTIVRLFSALLLPFQAIKCNCYEDYIFIHRFRLFLRKCEIVFENQTYSLHKIFRTFHKLITKKITEKELQEKIRSLLKGQRSLLESFESLFNLSKSNIRDEEYEDVYLEESNPEDEFETAVCPPDEDLEVKGSEKCNCTCHEGQGPVRLRHCLSCGLSTKNGKLYLKKNRKLESVNIVYNSPSKKSDDSSSSEDSVCSQMDLENSLEGDNEEDNEIVENSIPKDFSSLAEHLNILDESEKKEVHFDDTQFSVPLACEVDLDNSQFSVPRADNIPETVEAENNDKEKSNTTTSQQMPKPSNEPWTREEDKLILETCKHHQDCSFRVFFLLAQQMNRDPHAIAERCQYMAELFKKLKKTDEDSTS
ncbi:DgyrCDS2791 [Dimorphilus gyrociliatus]|uniref:DgyrCDS2791 n=1 Tax=Dimorphilus gyrociliatus TaxID=2664684 RepID=A0A7I8VGF6_9ANNE|nr:DgyrCDS2791 [Dimorphilus gyrociliatus]